MFRRYFFEVLAVALIGGSLFFFKETLDYLARRDYVAALLVMVIGVAVISAGPPVVRARTRFHATLGTGRPEEVVAALCEAAGRALDVGAIVRERVILARELPP